MPWGPSLNRKGQGETNTLGSSIETIVGPVSWVCDVGTHRALWSERQGAPVKCLCLKLMLMRLGSQFQG